VLLACSHCGAVIPESERKQSQWMSGCFLCAECRGKLPADYRHRAEQKKVCCERCDRPAPEGANQGRFGDYLCGDCRQELLADDQGVRGYLRRLFQTAGGEAEAQPKGYELGQELGRGSFGVVYKARRKRGAQVVALKALLSEVAVEEVARRRFFREIAIHEQLRHPHIVQLLESGSSGSLFYFVMEFCRGGSLEKLRKEHGGKLPLSIAAPIMRQCLAGLEFAHRHGIVHRDLKPENVLLQWSDGQWIAKIGDLGLAKLFEQSGFSGMTASRAAGGTPPFMAREQLVEFRRANPATDVWGIAATFYHILTGRFPRDFPPQATHVEMFKVILTRDAVPIRDREPGIPAAVADVLDRALRTGLTERYKNAGEMRQALEPALPPPA
jgi:serine/threonine protein kinase